MYLIANIAVDKEKRNVRKNDAFFAYDEKIVFWAFFTSERNEMKPYPTVRDAQLYLLLPLPNRTRLQDASI